ncbi:O-antigen ligase family protein [Lactiplantibacillus pingfangensis]|uniref:O-antigen ligase family protein n=1 Tax=Lactiplantibacillus pingfangensis TaxID=2559915 RepID=UPI0010F6A41E|nr:O-antigen ligase family protein [Lactiplantibacillus pingfangensis]
MIAQVVAMTLSFLIANNTVPMPGVLSGTVHFIELVTSIMLTYTAIAISIDSIADMRRFILGVFWSLLGFEILVLIPQIIATSTRALDPWVNFLGRWFEDREAVRPDFYWNGSYVSSLLRVNGFQGEASFLAAQLALVFIPFSIAAIRNRIDYFHVDSSKTKLLKYWLAIFSVLVILFFAKTTTGFLVIGTTLILLFLAANKREKVALAITAVIGLVLVGVAYSRIASIHTLLNEYLFNKGNTSNRLGNSIGLLMTFLHHPILGVGEGFTNYFTFEYVPSWTRNNIEYIQHILPEKSFAPQSVWGAMFAENGLIIMIPLLWFIWDKIATSWQMRRVKHEDSTWNERFKHSLMTAFYVYLLMFLILGCFSFQITDFSTLLMFFFFIHAINWFSDHEKIL